MLSFLSVLLISQIYKSESVKNIPMTAMDKMNIIRYYDLKLLIYCLITNLKLLLSLNYNTNLILNTNM